MSWRLVFFAMFLVMQYAVLFTDHQATYTELRNALVVSAMALHQHADTRVLKQEGSEYRLSDLAQDVGKKVPNLDC